MASSEKQCGVTPPISSELPTEAEKRSSEKLLEELRSQGTFEPASETQRRHKVLESLQTIANAFVAHVAKQRYPKNPTFARTARAKIFTYGGFRLGVFGPGSDIDSLVLVPRWVTREDYFEHFPSLLQSMAPPGAITDLTPVIDAFVPIIKFEFSAISIDLIFSRVEMGQLPTDPKWNLRDNSVLRGLDEAELRSLNGTRVADEILELVPETKIFKEALRAIKLWAQRRGIYANIMGFPGGVAWAIMVARVCQLYPRATSSVIVSKFFGIMLRWPWPNPVLLKNIEDGPLPVRIWNPKVYKGDSFHLMPIITPAYPSMCSTYNITRSSLTVIQRELSLASDLSNLIVSGHRPWKDLFTRNSFFTLDFKYYIMVTSASTDKESHNLWSGFIESKVRVLVQNLERHPSIALARPFNKGYERIHRCKGEAELDEIQKGSVKYIVQDTVSSGAKDEVDAAGADVNVESIPGAAVDGAAGTDAQAKKGETPDIEKTMEVYTSTHYIGLELANNARQMDLSFQVKEFKALCFDWEKYKKGDLRGESLLSVEHLRSFALPDDVFEPGETKPQRPLKKKPAAEAAAPSPAPVAGAPAGTRKRSASEAVSVAKRQQTSVPAAAPAAAAG